MVMRTDEVKAALARALALAQFINEDGDTLPEDVDGLLAVLAKAKRMATAVCLDVKALAAEDAARQAETNKLAADRFAEQQRADKAIANLQRARDTITEIGARFSRREATHNECESIDGFDPHDAYTAAMRRAARIVANGGTDTDPDCEE